MGFVGLCWVILVFFDFGFGRAITQRMASLHNADKSERSDLLWTALVITFLFGIVGGLFLWQFADYILANVVGKENSISARFLGLLVCNPPNK
jgi:O-antigen/teichoic acid export membrane protein